MNPLQIVAAFAIVEDDNLGVISLIDTQKAIKSASNEVVSVEEIKGVAEFLVTLEWFEVVSEKASEPELTKYRRTRGYRKPQNGFVNHVGTTNITP